MSLTKGNPATWGEADKQAPPEYIENILKTIYPNAIKIENKREEHISGCDWVILFKTGKQISIDDKNDLKLGITGNICLDEKTTEKIDGIQLFVNYPRFKGKYILVYNTVLRKLNLMEWIHERDQSWGGTTRAYIVPVENIESKIYSYFPELVNPSFDWFTIKH